MLTLDAPRRRERRLAPYRAGARGARRARARDRRGLGLTRSARRAAPGFELSVEAVEREILAWGIWGVAASILLMVLHSFVPFPAEVVAMANGMLYGPLWGTLITWVGAMLGAYLARAGALARPAVRPDDGRGRHHRAFDRRAARQGAGVLLFSRLMPVISFNLINYAAGLTTVPWWTFPGRPASASCR